MEEDLAVNNHTSHSDIHNAASQHQLLRGGSDVTGGHQLGAAERKYYTHMCNQLFQKYTSIKARSSAEGKTSQTVNLQARERSQLPQNAVQNTEVEASSEMVRQKTHGVETKKSPVWEYFIPSDNSAICQLCHRTVKRSRGNTSNLISHLRSAHHEHYEVMVEEDDRQKSETERQTPRENKRASRRIQNTDSSCRATADDTSFHTDDNADGDTSDMRGSHDAMLDSYVSTLLSNMGNEMLRSEDEIARVQEIRDPEYKYNSETCNQVPGTSPRRRKSSIARRSLVWTYFDVDVPGLVKCRLCEKLIKRSGGNTTNLAVHLRSSHQKQYDDMVEEDARQKGVTSWKWETFEAQLPWRNWLKERPKKMSKHSRQPKCKQLKMEPADEDFEQQRDEMDITSNAADGENSQGNNAAVSQSTVLDEDEQLGCEEVEDNESKCFAEASSQIRGKSSSTKTGKVETRNRGSSVWKYFVRLHKAAICKICRKSLKRSVGSTTNLLQHLKRAHSKEYAAAVVESSHRKMEEATRRMLSASSNATHADMIGSANFEVKRELVEMADGQSDDESNKTADDVMSGGRKMDCAKSRKRRSFVWKHFFPQGAGVVCKLCGKTLKRSAGNTTNLLKHLEREHRKEHAAVMEETGRRMMDEATRNMLDATLHAVAEEKSEVQGDDTGSTDSLPDVDDQQLFNGEDLAHQINVDKFKYFDNTSDEMTSSSVITSTENRKRSPVWKYFIYRRTCAVCKLCRKSLKRSMGNTTNLLQHLKRAHRKQYRTILEEYSRRKVEAEARDEEEKQNQMAYHEPSTSSSRVDQLTSLLVRFICSEGLSFDMVENDAFRAFIQALDPAYVDHLPTRQILSDKLVPELNEEVRSDVRTQLLQSTSRAVTVELWTNDRNRTYMSVLVHWLDDEFSSQHRCLAVKRVPRSHCADSLAAQLNDVNKEWCLDPSSLHVVVSGASVMKEALSKVAVVTWRPCFGDALQHCISTALGAGQVPGLEEILEKSRSIGQHFRGSNVAEKQLERTQEELGLPRKKLKLDCAERWNSVVTMLERLLEQRDAVCHALASSSGTRGVENLTPDQWTTAAQLTSTLRPFVEITQLLSMTSYPPLSLIIPAVNGLRHGLCELTGGHDGLRDVLLRLVDENFGDIFDNDELCAATVVDPRFKLLPFASERTRRTATDATVALMEHIHESMSKISSEASLSVSSTSVNSGPTLQTLGTVALSSAAVDVGATADASSFIPTSLLLHQQVVAYASERVIPRNKCPLTWWADNRQNYPLVSEVARKLLVIPTTAVSTERLFTKRGDEVMYKRDAVSPEKADQVLFIMENL